MIPLYIIHSSLGLQFDIHTLHLRGAITEEADLNLSAVKPDGLDDLQIAGNKINRLIIPLDIVTIHVKNQPLDRFLGGQRDGMPIGTNLDLQSKVLDFWELDKFERLGPVRNFNEHENINGMP